MSAPSDEHVHFVPEPVVRARVAEAFAAHAAWLRELLPGADVRHVGATALPGALTKGDLDIAVRMRDEDGLRAADRVLAARLRRNVGSTQHRYFSAFEAPDVRCSVGVQLVMIDSPLDVFVRIHDVLLARDDLREGYDALKRAHEGARMTDYRAAKGTFLRALFDCDEYRASWPGGVAPRFPD